MFEKNLFVLFVMRHNQRFLHSYVYNIMFTFTHELLHLVSSTILFVELQLIYTVIIITIKMAV